MGEIEVNNLSMIYLICGMLMAAFSVQKIVPFISVVLFIKPLNTTGMSEKRIAQTTATVESVRKRIGRSGLPDSWIIPVLAVSCTVICLWRGVIWPVTLGKMIWKVLRE